MKALVHEYDFEDCSKGYAKQGKKVLTSQICAIGKNGADACDGDSGGPLVYEKSEFLLTISIKFENL